MSQKILVSVYSWENPRLYSSDFDLAKGDLVVVENDYVLEIGKVERVAIETQEEPEAKIVRLANEKDRSDFEENENAKESALEKCKIEAKKEQLEMKVVDARISLDQKQIIFVFTADGRVDFRELVKVLSREFKKTIRMQQIGSRDEARKLGGFGVCGRGLCCVNFSGSIQSITTDMARVQQIAHRGTDRISGLCGRLMCCLAYEAQQYREMLIGMPEVYSVVNTAEGQGTVIEVNAVTQEIKVKLESGKYITLKKEEIK